MTRSPLVQKQSCGDRALEENIQKIGLGKEDQKRENRKGQAGCKPNWGDVIPTERAFSVVVPSFGIPHLEVLFSLQSFIISEGFRNQTFEVGSPFSVDFGGRFVSGFIDFMFMVLCSCC